MRYVSLFSGIEAATVAWAPLGWEAVAFAEIDPFACAVLAERFPNVPNLGDVSKIDWSPYRGAVDVIVGGSPCQAFSIAGKRAGLMDSRGRLMLEYVRACADVRPTWILWENVPGVLSQDGGRAFGTLLRELEDLGYGLAWRVLDAQFFGVAQRRRRVFLVGHAGGGAAPAAVLFESEGMRGDFASSAAKREDLAARAGRDAAAGRGALAFQTDNLSQNGTNVSREVVKTLDTQDPPAVCVAGPSTDVVCMASGQADATVTQDGAAPCLTCLHEAPIVIDAAATNQGEHAKFDPFIGRSEVAPTLTRGGVPLGSRS